MLKLRNRLITVLAILASVLIMGSVVFMFSKNAVADEPTLEGVESIESSYVVGGTISVPQAEVVVGGTNYAAETIYVYTPSGATESIDVANSEYKFEEIGLYKLVYVATVEGKQVSVSKEITVNNTSYTASKLTKIEDLQAMTVVKNSSEAGIKVSLPYTDTFTWSTPVDLSETGLSTPLLKFLPYQFSKEKAVNGTVPNQASNIFVRLTDAYDASVYVDVRLEYFTNNSEANQMPAYAAGAVRQQIRAMSTNLGRDSREGQIMFVGEDRYFVTYQERGGYPYLGGIMEDSCMLSLYYDLETNRVYVGQQTVGPDGYKVSLINDIDAPEIYGENAFKGFTNGEVYVSIFAENYVAETLEMEIASIGNQVGTDLHGRTAEDTTDPVLKVDVSLDQEDNGLYVAKGSEVKVLDWDVKDANFKGNKKSVKVQYNDATDVTVTNGKFLASELGKYTVTYRAEDDFGNETIKELVYNCIDCSANEGKLISFMVDEYTGDKSAGQEITLPQAIVSSPNTYVDVKVYALFGDSEDRIDVTSDGTLRIDNVGVYTIVYEYSDVFESGEYRYEMETVAGGNFEFKSEALPKYLIKGAKYSFDKVYVEAYSNTNPELVEVSYAASVDGSEYAEIDYSAYTVTANTSVKFKYSYGGRDEYSETIPVVDVGYAGAMSLDKSKYFQGGEITPEVYNGTSYAFVANAGLETATMDFVNVLSLNNLAINFTIPTEMRNYKSLSVTLTDYLDRSNSITVTYTDTGAGTTLGVSGGNKAAATKSFAGTQLALTYSASRGEFADNNLGVAVAWANNFKSDRVLISITLNEIVTGSKAGLVITSMCGEVINITKRDATKPSLTYSEAFKGNQRVGTQVTISSAVGIDVLSPAFYGNASMIVNVERQIDEYSREALVSDDGVRLSSADATRDYKVTLNEIGSYIVTYIYKDQKNNRQVVSYEIRIIDEVKPTIIIEGGYNEFSVVEANLGDIITAKDYFLYDNVDAEEDLIFGLVVIDPFFSMYDLIDNDVEIDDMKFTAEYRGEYIVYYYAEDTSGNVATASYRVFVK